MVLAAILMICVLVAIFLVNAVGLTRFLDTLDCTRCDFVLFAEFRNFVGKNCSTVGQFRWGIFPAYLLSKFGPLIGKSFYLLG